MFSSPLLPGSPANKKMPAPADLQGQAFENTCGTTLIAAPSRETTALRDAITSPCCNVHTRRKILGSWPFPAPSAAHLPAPHCGPLPPSRALFARADGFTSASTVFLFA